MLGTLASSQAAAAGLVIEQAEAFGAVAESVVGAPGNVERHARRQGATGALDGAAQDGDFALK